MNEEKNIFESMFDDVGSKIKGVATVVCWLGIIAFIALAIVMFVIASDSYSDGGIYTALGFVSLIAGPIFSCISSWLLYGFGELIDKMCSLEKHFCPQIKEDEKEEKTNNIVVKKQKYKCTTCGEDVFYGEAQCKHCGQIFDWTNIK